MNDRRARMNSTDGAAVRRVFTNATYNQRRRVFTNATHYKRRREFINATHYKRRRVFTNATYSKRRRVFINTLPVPPWCWHSVRKYQY